jgi:hypothetical protein
MTNGHEIDTCTQEMDRRAVATRMRMDAFGAERGDCCLRPFGVPPKQVPDTEAGHRVSTGVTKDRDDVHSRHAVVQ